MKHPLAVYVPVGPGCTEVARLRDLLESLGAYHDGAITLILVDDGGETERLSGVAAASRRWRVLIVENPRRGEGAAHTGGLCAATLAALRVAYRHTRADFVLKLDTDSLVIGPFAAPIAAAFARNRACGLVGVVGLSSNPAARNGYDIRHNRTQFEKALDIYHRRPNWSAEDLAELAAIGVAGDEALEHFAVICGLLEQVQRRGTLGEYCQGGGYAISRGLMASMQQRGFLKAPERWRHIRCGEDVMMGIYCSALGFEMTDLCAAGEPFAIQPGGLPYPLDELRRLGFSIIHSVKNDGRWSESDVRQYFQRARTDAAPPKRPIPASDSGRRDARETLP